MQGSMNEADRRLWSMAPGRMPYDFSGPVSRQHGQFPSPMQHLPAQQRMNFNACPPNVADDDEVWRQRRLEKTDEVNLVVERARQRRVAEEKKLKPSEEKKVDEKVISCNFDRKQVGFFASVIIPGIGRPDVVIF